ncbi:MAG TPA: hypothetical protein VMV17_07590 [Streptosporangiaceae bacterium]|nr:hypothetical protein [Streptosporangiaceae bacterium]
MADLRRLGKRGSYRLGRLGAPSAAPVAPSAPHYPVWVDRHRGPAVLWLLAWLVTVAVLAAGALAGWWFLPFVAGLAAGVAAHYGRWRLRVTLPATVLGAAAGWGAALWWLVRRGLPEGPVAREIAALAGLPAQALAAIAVTLLVAVIQALAGLWLGRALTPGRGSR